MSSGMIAAIVGLGASVVTALGVKLVDLIKSDSRLLTLSDVVEQTEKSMQAVDAWAKTYKAVEELPEGEFKTRARETALLALNRVRNKLEMADAERTVTVVGTRATVVVQKILRLTPPRRGYIWAPQLGFYFFFVLALTFLAMPARDFQLALISASLALGFWLTCMWLESRPSRT